MRIPELVRCIEFGEGVIDIEFRKMQPGSKRQLFDIGVTRANGDDILKRILEAASKVETYGPEMCRGSGLAVFESDVHIGLGRKSAAEKIEQICAAQFYGRRNELVQPRAPGDECCRDILDVCSENDIRRRSILRRNIKTDTRCGRIVERPPDKLQIDAVSEFVRGLFLHTRRKTPSRRW